MIDYEQLELTLANVIRAAVGDMLTQETDSEGSYGIVLTERPKGDDALIPNYPYAVMDHLFTLDTQGPTTKYYLDPVTGDPVYLTSKEVHYQIDLFGNRYDTLQIANTLESKLKLPFIQEMFERECISIKDRGTIVSDPQLYDTNFVEKGMFQISFFIYDKETDPLSGRFNIINIQDSNLTRLDKTEIPINLTIG